MEKVPIQTYRDVLRNELDARIARNSRYSLRSFSRDIGVFPSQLSRIFRGEADFSLSSGKSVAKKLFSDAHRRDAFITLFLHSVDGTSYGNTEVQRAIAALSQKASVVIAADKFSSFNKWYHYAILECVDLSPRLNLPRDFAKKVGVSAEKARQALESLVKAGFIEKIDDGYSRVWPNIRSGLNQSEEAVQMYHRIMLDRATKALAAQRVDERFFAGQSLAIAREHLNELIEITRSYMLQIGLLAEKSKGTANSVYQVQVQIFSLLKTESEKS